MIQSLQQEAPPSGNANPSLKLTNSIPSRLMSLRSRASISLNSSFVFIAFSLYISSVFRLMSRTYKRHDSKAPTVVLLAAVFERVSFPSADCTLAPVT